MSARTALLLGLALCLAGASCAGEGTTASSDVPTADATPTTQVPTAAALHEALAAATPGDVVELAEGRFEGAFSLPAGVTLRGQGSDRTILAGAEPVVLSVAAGGSPTVVSHLGVESAGWGIVARGTDTPADTGRPLASVDILSVRVDSSAGTALALIGLGDFDVRDTVLQGNVLESDAPGIDLERDGDRLARVGLRVERCPLGRISSTRVAGFASAGAVFSDSSVTWSGGTVQGNLNFGIYATDGARLELIAVTVDDTWSGRYEYGWGATVVRGATLLTDEAVFSDNVVGLAHLGYSGSESDGSFGDHTDLTVRGSGTRGVWIQDCGLPGDDALHPIVSIRGDETRFEGNAGVALGIMDSFAVDVSGGAIADTSAVGLVSEGTQTGLSQMGDGVLLVRAEHLRFADLALLDNARIGLLLDGVPRDADPSTPLDVRFTDVTIDGAEGARGVAIQNAALTDDGAVPTVLSTALTTADDQARGAGAELSHVRGVDAAGMISPSGAGPPEE